MKLAKLIKTTTERYTVNERIKTDIYENGITVNTILLNGRTQSIHSVLVEAETKGTFDEEPFVSDIELHYYSKNKDCVDMKITEIVRLLRTYNKDDIFEVAKLTWENELIRIL